MPSSLAHKDQQFRLARETSYGVTPGSPAWRKIPSMALEIGSSPDTEPFTASGDAVPSLVVLNDEYTQGDLTGKLDYESIPYVYSSFFGDANITTPGGGTISRDWDWLWNGSDPILPVSYVIQRGSPATGAEQANGALFNALGFSGARDGFDLNASLFAKIFSKVATLGGLTNEVQTISITGTPTGGTFTLTFKGQTTAPIPYNASAAAIQTALEGLGTIQAGQVAVTGGALPGTPAVVTFTGLLGGRDVPLMTANSGALTGGTSPTVTVTATTAGADAGTTWTPKPIFPGQMSLYLDTSWAALGGTLLTQTYEAGFSFGEKWVRTRPINASLSSDSYVEKSDQEITVDLTMAVDAQQDTMISALRAGSPIFLRFEAIGPTIEGALEYRHRFDCAAYVTDVGRSDDYNSINVRKLTARIGRDGTSGNAVAVNVRNTRTSL